MEKLKITLFLACTIITLVGCLGNTGTEPTIITDPSATTHLSISNQSGIDLTAMYKTTDEYGSLDSTVTVPIDSLTRILSQGALASLHPQKP